MFGHFLTLFCGHVSLVSKIGFITNQDPGNVVSSVLFHFGHPIVYVLVRFLVRDVICDDDTMSAFVVASSNCFEALLTRSIPNLELDLFAIDLDSLDFEVHSNRGHEVVSEHVIRKPD